MNEFIPIEKLPDDIQYMVFDIAFSYMKHNFVHVCGTKYGTRLNSIHVDAADVYVITIFSDDFEDHYNYVPGVKNGEVVLYNETDNELIETSEKI